MTIEFINKRIIEQFNYMQYIEVVSHKTYRRKRELIEQALAQLFYFEELKREYNERNPQEISSTIQKS